MSIGRLFILLLFPTAFAQAQNSLVSQQTNASTASFSIAPSLGLTSFSFAGNSDWQPKTGLSAGALADFGRGYFSFETGVLYIQQGARVSSELTAGGRKYEIASAEVNLEYLAIPLLGRYNFSGDAQKGFFIKGGVMPETLIGKEAKLNVLGYGASTRDFEVASNDVLLVAGGGLEVPFSQNGSFRGDLTYNHGVVKVNSGGDNTLNNSGFLAAVGAMFAF